MRRLLTALTALSALLLCSTLAHAAEPTELDRTVDGIEAYYKKITAFRASFAQVVQRAHLPRPLKRSGKVYFKAPGKMRWDYTQPDKVYYVSDGDVLWSYEVETKQCIKMGVKQSELYDSLKFLFGQGDLRGSFDVSAVPAKDGLVGVKLVPKTGQSNYKSLTLYADPKTFEIGRSELIDPLDNVSTITFSKVSYEDISDDKVFQFTPPRGVTVQDLTRSAPEPAPPGER